MNGLISCRNVGGNTLLIFYYFSKYSRLNVIQKVLTFIAQQVGSKGHFFQSENFHS